jgi:hypothetical protein
MRDKLNLFSKTNIKADTIYRFELKYLISNYEYNFLKSLLKSVMTLDLNCSDDDMYRVRSLYFDTLDNTDMYDKLSGIKDRKKVRLRLYNLDDKLIKLEMKNKKNNYTYKETLQISNTTGKEIINGNYKSFYNNKTHMSTKFYNYFALNKIKPKVIIEYLREAYIYSFSNIRINFDKEIKASYYTSDIYNRNLTFVPIIKPDLIILEIKYKDFIPIWLKKILLSAKVSRTSFSKYLIAREIQRGE